MGYTLKNIPPLVEKVKYVTGERIKGIGEQEIERETPKYVWVNGNRERKITSWKRYHDSREAAKSHLISKQSKVIELIKHKLELEMFRLKKIRNL
jgi:hypothetical protein